METKPRPPIYDIDLLSLEQAAAFIEAHTGREREMFPSRPQGYQQTARTLIAMCWAKLREDPVYYEMLYKRLPEYAKFRQDYLHSILADVAEGKRFLKRPSKRLPIENVLTADRSKRKITGRKGD